MKRWKSHLSLLLFATCGFSFYLGNDNLRFIIYTVLLEEMLVFWWVCALLFLNIWSLYMCEFDTIHLLQQSEVIYIDVDYD